MSDGFFCVPLRPIMKRFMKLSFAALVLVASFVLAGCQNRPDEPPVHRLPYIIPEDTTEVNADSVASEVSLLLEAGVVLQRVTSIYDVVLSEFRSRGGAVENELLDYAYCSRAWNKLLMAVHYKEHLTGTLFFEVNHWSMTENPGVVTFDEFKITNINVTPGEKRATVAFTVYEQDTWEPAQIDLVFEDGEWKIDNFYQMKYRIDLRTAMWDYLEKDMM